MKNFAQGLVNSLDKTTVDGFSEALLICISNLRDDQGRYLHVRLSEDPAQSIEYARQIAKSMLSKDES